MKIVNKIKNNFYSLSDLWLFISIILGTIVLPLMIKFLPLPRMMQVITPASTKQCNILDDGNTKEKIIKYTDYILSRNFFIWRDTCLKRSLLLYHFLNKIGVKVRICFGVKYNDTMISKGRKGSLEGHAWLLLNGEIFLERNIEIVKKFAVAYCFPSFQRQVRRERC
jgi:hypothetical protein